MHLIKTRTLTSPCLKAKGFYANLDKNNKERYDKLNDKLDGFYGWFQGASIANGRPVKDKLKFLEENEGSLSLQYEPKFDLALSKLPPKIYHLTLFRKVDKIKKLGLSPRR